MKRVILFSLLGLMLIIIACNSSSDTKDTSETKKDSASYFDSTASVSLAKERDMQLNLIIEAAKMTLDSIDAAYTFVRSSSKLMSLSLDDREQLNFALQQMKGEQAKEILAGRDPRCFYHFVRRPHLQVDAYLAEIHDGYSSFYLRQVVLHRRGQ